MSQSGSPEHLTPFLLQGGFEGHVARRKLSPFTLILVAIVFISLLWQGVFDRRRVSHFVHFVYVAARDFQLMRQNECDNGLNPFAAGSF